MKLALITDIHANREAFEACLDDAQQKGADRYALLGDFVGYGADPHWVVERVRALVAEGAIAIRGNHDEAVVQGPREGMNSDATQVINWTRSQLDDDQLTFLSRLPFAVERYNSLFAHANGYAPQAWEYVTSRSEACRACTPPPCPTPSPATCMSRSSTTCPVSARFRASRPPPASAFRYPPTGSGSCCPVPPASRATAIRPPAGRCSNPRRRCSPSSACPTTTMRRRPGSLQPACRRVWANV
jgi:predicted phosphodiesterase